MCLDVPGEVIEIYESQNELLMGKVHFRGISKEVCLAYVPGVEVGDYVIVHVEFVLNQLDEAEAGQVFTYLSQMEELAPFGAADEPHANRQSVSVG